MDLLISARSLQLEKQAELDTKLRKCQCTDTVMEYLLHRRQVNRQQYKLVHEGGFMEAYNNIQGNLKEIESDQASIESILSSVNPCSELKNYLDKRG